MMDIHDANLPTEKTGELEEAKTPEIKPESATEEIPAEESVEDVTEEPTAEVTEEPTEEDAAAEEPPLPDVESDELVVESTEPEAEPAEPDVEPTEPEEEPTEPEAEVEPANSNGKLTKEEIVDKLAEAVHASVETVRNEVELLKQAYYKIRRFEVEELKNAFLEGGGDETDFHAPEDEIRGQSQRVAHHLQGKESKQTCRGRPN